MYLRIGNRIINTDNIVEVTIFPARPQREDDEEPGRVLPPKRVSVEVVTTAIESRYDDGGDYRTPHTEAFPYALTLAGDEAEKFLSALPAYEPVEEEKEETRTNDSPHLAYTEGLSECPRKARLVYLAHRARRRLLARLLEGNHHRGQICPELPDPLPLVGQATPPTVAYRRRGL